MEIWRDIEGYEGLYMVSNYGNVKSISYQRTGEEKIRKLSTHGNYFVCNLSRKSKAKNKYVHRLVAQAFPDICGKWFEGCVVDHKDTNTLNNMAENLRVTDAAGNSNNPITLKKLSASSKHRNAIPIVATKEGKEYSFPSISDFAKYCNRTAGQAVNVLKGRKHTICGFTLEYA